MTYAEVTKSKFGKFTRTEIDWPSRTPCGPEPGSEQKTVHNGAQEKVLRIGGYQKPVKTNGIINFIVCNL